MDSTSDDGKGANKKKKPSTKAFKYVSTIGG